MFEPYPFGQVAGNLRTQGYIMKFVDPAKVQIVLLAPFETEFTKKTRDAGVETIVADAGRRVNRYGGTCLKDGTVRKFMTFLDILKYNQQLAALFKREKIDVIYCNCIRGVLTLGLAALFSRRPLLWYIKGELQNPLLDTLGFLLSKKILFFCATNRDDKYPLLIRLFRKKIGILKIGIDVQTISDVQQSDVSALKKELGIGEQSIHVVYIGQIYPPKGVHHLLEAVALLKEACPEIRLYLVGDPILKEYEHYLEELRRIIDRHGIAKNVIFTGWRTDALRIVSVMDILVHPSLSEGFGRAVLEGMALGKPVVASRVGGIREIIKDGINGLLVDPGQPQMIADKLRLLVRNSVLRESLGREARRTVFAEYLIQDKVAQLQMIWEDMAARRARKNP
jgi:glycosyltransferase involved in cell wall biosynthesis